MTRPGPKGDENVWVHDAQTGQYVLRDTDGTEYARFDSAEEIFADASKYPDGGECNIKPPIIPEYEFDGVEIADLDGSVDAVERDTAIVPEPDRDEEENKELLAPDELERYRHDAPNVPIIDLLETDTTKQTATTNNGETAAAEDDAPQTTDDLQADVLGMRE